MIEFIMLFGLASVVAIVSLGFLDKIRNRYSNKGEKEAETTSLQYQGHTISANMPYDEAKALLREVAQDYLAINKKKEGLEEQIIAKISSCQKYAENETSQTLIDMQKQRVKTEIHGDTLNIRLANKQLEVLDGYGRILGAIVKKHKSVNEKKQDSTPDLRKHIESEHASAGA